MMMRMTGLGPAPQPERAIRLMAVAAGGVLFVCVVLAMVNLIGFIWRSTGPVDAWKVLLGVIVLGGLAAAAVIVWRVYQQGWAGARQVGAWLTETIGGKVLNGVVCIVIADTALLYGSAVGGWSHLSSIAVAVLWTVVGAHWLRRGWRQSAAHRQLSRYGPDIERIPE